MYHRFFKNQGPIKVSEIINSLNININNVNEDKQIHDIKDLVSSTKNDITFFHSKKYKDVAKKTKASYCLTTEVLKTELPDTCLPLVVKNKML